MHCYQLYQTDCDKIIPAFAFQRISCGDEAGVWLVMSMGMAERRSYVLKVAGKEFETINLVYGGSSDTKLCSSEVRHAVPSCCFLKGTFKSVTEAC